MSYTGQETSALGGSPVELYEFSLSGQSYRYTSQTTPVAYDGFTYTPAAIVRNNPKLTDERSGVQLTITVPTSLTIAQAYVAIVPTSRMVITIYRQHRTDGGTPETITFWKGYVTSVKFKDEFAELICEPIQALFAREIPRHSYSALCNHVLYDSGCQASKGTFSDIVTVSAISSSGEVLTLDSLSTERPGDSTFYTGGYVERYNGDKRLILEYTYATDQVRLLLPFSGITVGEEVTARAGCAHDIDTCLTKFSNVLNFGGFPWSPDTNPFEVGVGNS